MAKKGITKTSVHKKLEQLGTHLINQANNNKALENIGRSNDTESLKNAINSIFEEVSTNYDVKRLNEIIGKGKGLLSLIKSNIATAKKSKNFDLESMESDHADLQDIIFRIESIKVVNIDQLKRMNELNAVHSKIQKLIKDSYGKL